jgi:arginyl-tRNA synthetase
MTVDGREALRGALARAAAELGAPGVDFVVERPREGTHGDLATNIALVLARPLRRAPRDVAQELLETLAAPAGLVARSEIAGPGFINFWLAEATRQEVVRAILEAGARYGRSDAGRGTRVNVEFVSANPTGPLHVGHGRGAALGDAIAALLEWIGHDVTRECYLNDAGGQIERLAESMWARVQQAVGRDGTIPEGGYHGAYLTELASAALAREGQAFADLPEREGRDRCRAIAVAAMLDEQERDLGAFGVRFDTLSRETDVYATGLVEAALEDLAGRDMTFDSEGALWLRTSSLGDDRDRVLRKQDGSYTYFTPDIAYHREKARRGFQKAIDIWGADHHGYVPRMQAAMAALGLPGDFFHAVIVQLVRVVRGGEEVRFSKRSGEFYSLRDLLGEVGSDAARYFFLMRPADSQFVFDIELAKRQREDNPVFYVQYAHTRLAGIFRTAGLDPTQEDFADADLSQLVAPEEQSLATRLADFPDTVRRAADALEPHRVIGYLEDLARAVSQWYHACRVVGEPAAVERARLALTRATQIVLTNGLGLLGISAPERM